MGTLYAKAKRGQRKPSQACTPLTALFYFFGSLGQFFVMDACLLMPLCDGRDFEISSFALSWRMCASSKERACWRGTAAGHDFPEEGWVALTVRVCPVFSCRASLFPFPLFLFLSFVVPVSKLPKTVVPVTL